MGFAPLRQITAAEARAHDLVIARDAAAGIIVRTAYGRIALGPDSSGCRAEVISERPDFLQMLKDS